MKSKLLHNLGYWILILPAGVTYFVVDSFRSLKRKRYEAPITDMDIRHSRKTTIYPDETLEENDWYNYIYNERNKK